MPVVRNLYPRFRRDDQIDKADAGVGWIESGGIHTAVAGIRA